MKFITRFSLSLLLALLGLVAQANNDLIWAQPMGAEGNDSSARRALLIGINKYKGLPRLQGSINDIETMRHILITRWGFSEKDITMVTDEAATRAGILAALEQLVKDTGPKDTVYLHYSGHGSQVQDLNGDEKDDGLDETIVPQDGRTGDVRDITDDELDEIISRLRARSALVVLDSCHSGTATRSVDIRTRSVPRDTRIDLYRKGMVLKRAVVPLISSRFVLMTGAASHQEALDGPVEGRYHGFFTYALSRSLSSAGPDASPREVFDGVERELKRIQTQFGRSSMPEPQLEAPPGLLDTPLLIASREGSPSSPSPQQTRLPWIEVQPKEADRVVLVNGLLLGAGPGSTWSIYQPGDTTFTPGRALAVATVTQLQGKDALARLTSTGTKIPSGARAVSLLPPPAAARVSIRIADLPRERRQLIEETLRKHVKDVDIVEGSQQARFLVDVQGNSLRLFSAEGLQPVGSYALDNERWGAGLALVVSRSANASELLALDNPSSQLKVKVRVATTKPPVTARGVAVVADTQPAHYRIRRQGESRTSENSLQLEIRTSADGYITVVDVDSEGGVNLLFPTQHQRSDYYPEGRVRSGKAVLLPDSLQPGNRAGFHWDYTPPQGTDTIRVFTSTDLETAKMIRQRVQALQASAGQARGGVTTRAAVAASVGSLRQDLAQVATRGFVQVPDPTPAVPTTPVADSGHVASPPPPNPPSPPAPTGADPAMSAGGPAPGAPLSVTPAEPPLANQVAPDWTATSVTILVEG